MIDRMADLAETTHLDNDLAESLTRSLRSFFDETTGIDREYLTKAATEFVAQMRDAEAHRIQNAVPDKRAAMSLIQRAGKIIACLPDAIKQTLLVVQFNSEAPSVRDQPEDEAEFEEEDVQVEGEPQGLPASRTPPGPPPPWNPRENPSTLRTGRVQPRKLFSELKHHKPPTYLLLSGRVGRQKLDQPSQIWNSPGCHLLVNQNQTCLIPN